MPSNEELQEGEQWWGSSSPVRRQEVLDMIEGVPEGSQYLNWGDLQESVRLAVCEFLQPEPEDDDDDEEEDEPDPEETP